MTASARAASTAEQTALIHMTMKIYSSVACAHGVVELYNVGSHYLHRGGGERLALTGAVLGSTALECTGIFKTLSPAIEKISCGLNYGITAWHTMHYEPGGSRHNFADIWKHAGIPIVAAGCSFAFLAPH